ncbi:MAG TPA: YXWGXW repeat-containing protein [Steroidobacteraceae bacterium]|jgi:hypothetical protein|nr:YXWGXW repeat-containing protein [Steroidobacteraceae bacterium]
MRYAKFLALIPVLLIGIASALSQAAVDINVSVNLAPPPIPVYDQPPLPAPGYLWTPGYWAWDGMDYYWVPGTWVEPPVSGLLWTPGYWDWDSNGSYVWNAGYWAPEVGFYGGIDYGYGYGGSGYLGGYWHGGAFFYNRSVANFGNVNIVNVYTAPARHWGRSHVSFNGGQGGVRARPTQHDRAAMSERHVGLTSQQSEHRQQAQGMRELHASQNGGRPQILTTQRAADFTHPGPGLRNHQAPRTPAAAPQLRTGEAAQVEHQEGQRGHGAPAMRAAPVRPQPREQVQRHEQVQQQQQQRQQQERQQQERQQQEQARSREPIQHPQVRPQPQVQDQRPPAGEQAARRQPQAHEPPGAHPEGQQPAHDKERRDPAEQHDH